MLWGLTRRGVGSSPRSISTLCSNYWRSIASMRGSHTSRASMRSCRHFFGCNYKSSINQQIARNSRTHRTPSQGRWCRRRASTIQISKLRRNGKGKPCLLDQAPANTITSIWRSHFWWPRLSLKNFRQTYLLTMNFAIYRHVSQLSKFYWSITIQTWPGTWSTIMSHVRCMLYHGSSHTSHLK